ncbi:hypothetical protein QJS10_CPA10g01329 [Acorus calamus]|uniref:Uncharacterized protein n=1 Tax=Acorus calamus TaxID=4465 RepID=A0AAV9DZG1_ACOCL|nr:hypothetical protein QJS10_CPA10g01329 [Acorus calamus]
MKANKDMTFNLTKGAVGYFEFQAKLDQNPIVQIYDLKAIKYDDIDETIWKADLSDGLYVTEVELGDGPYYYFVTNQLKKGTILRVLDYTVVSASTNPKIILTDVELLATDHEIIGNPVSLDETTPPPSPNSQESRATDAADATPPMAIPIPQWIPGAASQSEVDFLRADVERLQHAFAGLHVFMDRHVDAQAVLIEEMENLLDMAETLVVEKELRVTRSLLELPVWGALRDLVADLANGGEEDDSN